MNARPGTNATPKRYGIGLMLGLALMLAMIAAAPSAAAQEEIAGSLVVYAYACPAGFTGEDYDQCRATPLAGAGYTAFAAGQDNGVGATTDADGVASIALAAIGGGTVNVAVTPPAGYEPAFVACSEEHGAIEGGITFAALATDAFVTCQWYFVPTGGTPGGEPAPDEDGWLTITAYACPADFDGEDYAACRARPQAGVGFTTFAVGQDNGVGATTDAAGTLEFALFAADLPGDIGVAVDLPAGYAAFEVACQSAPGIAADYAATDTGITLVDVPDGAEIACAWFNFPAGGDDADPAPVVGKLPNTGAGPDGSRSAEHTLLATLLAAGFVATAVVAVGMRRQA